MGHNDRGASFRSGARAARPLPGRLDYIRHRLVEVGVLIIEATRDADTQQRSRWTVEELVELGRDVADLIARCNELRARMMDKGLGAHALGMPIPLELSSSRRNVLESGK